VFGIPTAALKTNTIVALALILAYFAFRAILRKMGRKLPTSMSTWKSYLGGQGTLLFGFLIIGGVLASAASYFGPRDGKTSKGGRLIEYRQLNPSEHVVYEEQDVENYDHITVLARTTAPQNGSATVVIYGDAKGGGRQEISRIKSAADSWSQWDQQNSSKHITLKIINEGTETGATQVDVLLYLFPK
jgi:hypothetical protein